jgi:hypothetical protein
MRFIGLWHGITLNFVFLGDLAWIGFFLSITAGAIATRQAAVRIKARPWLDHGLTVFFDTAYLSLCRPRLGMVCLPDSSDLAAGISGLLGGGRSLMSYRFLRTCSCEGVAAVFSSLTFSGQRAMGTILNQLSLYNRLLRGR